MNLITTWHPFWDRGQLRPPRPDQMCPGGANWGMFNDLGVYGVPRAVREKKR